MTHRQAPQVKIIGSNGQLSLGKTFAGKMVLVDQLDDGTWLIKAGTFIPDSEQWLQKAEDLASLDRALTWAEKNKPQDNFKQAIEKLNHK